MLRWIAKTSRLAVWGPTSRPADNEATAPHVPIHDPRRAVADGGGVDYSAGFHTGAVPVNAVENRPSNGAISLGRLGITELAEGWQKERPGRIEFEGDYVTI